MPSVRSFFVFATTALAAFSAASAAATPKHARNELLTELQNDVTIAIDNLLIVEDAPLTTINERNIPVVGDLLGNLPIVRPLMSNLPLVGPLLGQATSSGGGLLGGLLSNLPVTGLPLNTPLQGRDGQVIAMPTILRVATEKLGDLSKQLDTLTAGKDVVALSSLSPILQALTIILFAVVQSLGGLVGQNQETVLGGLSAGAAALQVFGLFKLVVGILSGVLTAAGPSGAPGVIEVITNAIGPVLTVVLALFVKLVPSIADVLSDLFPTICNIIPAAVRVLVPGTCIGN